MFRNPRARIKEANSGLACGVIERTPDGELGNAPREEQLCGCGQLASPQPLS